MANDNQESPGLSDETRDYLEEVKKGKSRKFAMICKGTNIVSLVVYKKGSVEKYKKEAKSAGKGQFYFGTVEGRGQDVTFKLAREDGFDSAPVKTQALKHFLDEGGIKSKPLFEIVDTAPIALDEDDPLAARFLKLQESALQACDAYPTRVAEIEKAIKSTALILSEGESDQAEAQVNAFEQLLKSLGPEANLGPSSTSSGAPATSAPSQPTAGPSSSDQTQREKLQAALNKLVPQLKQAVANHPQRKVELLTPVAQIKRQLEQGELAAAREGLLSVGMLLKSLLQSTAGGSTGTEPASGIRQGTVDFAKCRLAWDATKKRVHADLQKLESAILAEYQNSPAVNELKASIRKLDLVLESFAEDLSDMLDKALNATDPAERTKHHNNAATTVDKFLAHATNDAFINQLHTNPFVPIEIKTTLTATLGALIKKLA